jgi:hypothetical protein
LIRRPSFIAADNLHRHCYGLDAGEYVRVHQVNAPDNLLTVERETGERVTYDPRRLQGVMLYREESA